MNMTSDKDGKWRSLESREIFRLYKAAGAVYRQQLAHEVQKLGYAVEQRKDSMFDLAAVPKEAVDAFSTRGQQIERALAERGKNRETAKAQEKAVLALDTRQKKTEVDRAQLIEDWRSKADSLGFGKAERTALITETTKAAGRHNRLLRAGKSEALANQALASAARSLSERSSVISAAMLERQTGEYAFGKISREDISNAVEGAVRMGELEKRIHVDNRGVKSSGYVTRAAVRTEMQMIATEGRGREAVKAPFDRVAAARAVGGAMLQSKEQGYKWTSGQKEATAGILGTNHRIIGIQGYAGTAKTTTVLATYAGAMTKAGYRVRAFAPTANAAAQLGEAIGPNMNGPSKTVASMTLGGEKIVQQARKGAPEAWIVDEASMVSSKDMARMLSLAERANARVVLVGDVKQLGSVEAGRAFGQLQESGMKTWKLDEIVRQDNSLTREAVLATIAGDGRRALEALDKGGGKVIELSEQSDRISALARDFAALGRDERRDTLVLDPSREGREKLTDAIRQELLGKKELGREALKVSILESRGLTKEEARYARNYEVGDAVTFQRSYDLKGISKDEAYTISKIDQEKNRIELADRNGQKLDWRLDKWGRGQSQTFAQVEKEFRPNDKIQFTRNDPKKERANGEKANIINVDLDRKTILIRTRSGQERTLNAAQTADRHIRHGWVSTIYSAQSATAKNTMVHMESFRANTVDAKSAYVALSRAKNDARLYTDSRSKIAEAISSRTQEKQTAMTQKSQQAMTM